MNTNEEKNLWLTRTFCKLAGKDVGLIPHGSVNLNLGSQPGVIQYWVFKNHCISFFLFFFFCTIIIVHESHQRNMTKKNKKLSRIKNKMMMMMMMMMMIMKTCLDGDM